MLQVLTAGAMLFSTLAAPAAPAVTPPPADKMSIQVASANGSGCADDTASITVSPDNQAFTISYSEYTAQVGLGATPTDFRKNCQISLNVHVPSGFTYAIASTDYRGYHRLAAGASGYQQASYYFQGYSGTARARHNFAGPVDGDWQTTDQVGIGALTFLKCGDSRFLNINTELRVSAGTSDTKTTTSLLTMDSTDTSLDTVYHLAWQKC
jgi:hypothetical protein